MFTILDIDQDFLWAVKPNYQEIVTKDAFYRKYNIRDLLERYEAYGKPAKIFIQHFEVLEYMRYKNYKDVQLIHLDRHDDLDRETYQSYNKPLLENGNWVSHAIRDGLLHSMDWISHSCPMPQYIHKEPNGACCPISTHTLDSHDWKGRISEVYFTVSPGFCKNDNSLLEFLRLTNPECYREDWRFI
ncbi:MAG: hypothetical protein ACE144_17085 [Thermodesulfobacteriota bacterium]